MAKGFAFGHVLEVAGALHRAEFDHALHSTGNGGEVRKHSTQPALVYEGHPAGLGVVLDRTLGLLLGADEQDDAAIGDQVAHVGVARLDAGEGLSKVNQVDTVALTKDETTHLGIPTAGLVPEVNTRVQ